MERAKKALDSKQRHLMTMEHQRGGGDLYFKSSKDACMSSNLKALHIYFYSLQENPQRSSARLKKKRKKKKESLS
jgi:general stress protein 26